MQRHVSAARLQDPQQRNNHLGGSVQAHSHQGIRAYTQLAEIMSHLVRLLVQLTVGKFSIFEPQCRPVRRMCGLFLEQLVDAALFAIIGNRLVPINEDLAFLRLA